MELDGNSLTCEDLVRLGKGGIHIKVDSHFSYISAYAVYIIYIYIHLSLSYVYISFFVAPENSRGVISDVTK